MLFNSYTFWIFFAIVLIVHRRLPHRGQNRLLLVASYVFYGYWDWRFLSLILASTVVDYFVALSISQEDRDLKQKKLFLFISLAFNLGMLGVFKYLDFFIAETSAMMRGLGMEVSDASLGIILPVGISYYTFQTLSYTVDVYRGKTAAVRGFYDFALYVSFFPQLVAGPIERSTRLMPQIINPRTHQPNAFRDGLYHIVYGLFMKIVVADNMAVLVNHVFELPGGELGGVTVMIGVYAFAFQIYADFAGYSSIAKGVARWLGFDLMTNFNHPYFSASPREFWQRWHISLSSWLRDYLYIPLGGNRGGAWKTARNLLTTMLLGGLWHGANWTFLIWGLIHGVWLGIHRVLGSREGLRILKIFATFHLVCLTWLFFRAETLTQATSMLMSLGSGWQLDAFAQFAFATIAFYLLPLIAYEIWVERKGSLLALTQTHWAIRACVYIYVVLMLLYFSAPVQNEFIYFQF
jgi:alginate O-acetyltransferase complex protein AlgI